MLGGYDMKEIPKHITYHYIFESNDKPRKEFMVKLDGISLNRIERTRTRLPEWTRLKYKQCSNCPLNPSKVAFCPVATGLIDIIDLFKDTISHEKGKVTVITEGRTVSKETAIQEGVSSLVGIYMVSSGCPIMEKLKPMVRYHLPFATINETIYRSTSMYLLGQYFVKKEGKQPDYELKGLIDIYKEIAKLNLDMSHRIRAASNEDASVNALVILDIFAKILPFSIEDTLAKLEFLFAPYLKE